VLPLETPITITLLRGFRDKLQAPPVKAPVVPADIAVSVGLAVVVVPVVVAACVGLTGAPGTPRPLEA